MKKRLSVVRLLAMTVLLLAFRLSSLQGQVATLKNWTGIYHGFPTTGKQVDFAVPAGTNSNRILIVAVATSNSSANTSSVSLSYGGQTLNQAIGDVGVSTYQHTALFYLNESGLDAASNSTFTFSVSSSGGTECITDLWAAVFDHVNQASPLTGSQNYNSGVGQVSGFSFAAPLPVNAYNQAIEVVSSFRPQNYQIRTITYAPEWTMVRDSTASRNVGFNWFSIRNGVANRAIPLSDITDISPTSFNGDARASMSALSLNYQAPPPPTVPATNVTFSNVTAYSFTVSWTPGDGINRLVVVRSGSAVNGNPVNGTTYTASNIFGSGSETSAGNFVVYNGTGNSLTVYNLEAATTYHVAVFEFSGPPGLEYYLIPNPARGSQLTLPDSPSLNDYRTNGSGNWNDAGIWQNYDGASWVQSLIAPTSVSGIITIRNGHTVTVSENVAADQVVIEEIAQVIIDDAITLTIDNDTDDAVDCLVNGTIINRGNIAPTGAISFTGVSVYNHERNGGSVPAATWDPLSDCIITGITSTSPAGLNQIFGNFTWNSALQSVTATINGNATIAGNFRITGTGTGKLALTSNSAVTLTVGGNFFQTGGTLDFNAGAASTAVSVLNVAGNFYTPGGTITETSLGRGTIVFNGAGSPQLYTSGGILSNTINFIVQSGAWLQMGSASNISGSNGTFTVSTGATLGITDRYGITLTNNTSTGGNIRVSGTRTFDPGATYIYNGAIQQNTNTGLPPTINNLVIDNPAGPVTFNAARTVTNEFSITTGSRANLAGFTHSATFLVLGGIGQTAGSYGGETSPAENIRSDFFEPATGIVNCGAPEGSWLGITTEWNSGPNWVGGIPTSGTHARIFSNVANQPVISGGATALGDVVTINHGASVTIGNTGAATFGTINNFGTLSINSGPGGTGSLILDSYTGTGTTNIQLWLTGGGDESNYPWHYISSPVASLSTDAVLKSGSDPDGSDLAAYYENLVTDNKDAAWYGYDGWDYQAGDYSNDPGFLFDHLTVGSGYNYYGYFDATRVFGGVPNTGNYNLPLSCSVAGDQIHGWNLLGNPYTSSINWDDIALTLPAGGEIDNAIYFTRNNAVVSYVDGVPSAAGVTGDIPPMQGFFVKANAAGQSLGLPATARLHSSQPRYKGEGESQGLIRLKLEGGNFSDETVIRLNEKANYTFDRSLDAYKFGNSPKTTGLWTSSGPVSYSINSIPFPETEAVVLAGINIPEDGTYKLTAGLLQGLENYNVLLTDKATGITTDLRNTPSFSFTSSEGRFNGRFAIRISNRSFIPGNTLATEDKFNIYSSPDMINIVTLSEEWNGLKGSVEILDISGRPLLRNDNVEFVQGSLLQLPAGTVKGLVFVRLRSSALQETRRVVVR